MVDQVLRDRSSTGLRKHSTIAAACARLLGPVWAVFAALVITLVGLIAFQVWLSARTVPVGQFRTDFERISGLETQWDGELMSLQLGFLSNYDTVTATARDLELRLRDLGAGAAGSPSLAPLLPQVETYREALERKIWLSEQIKASYAMLRNSVSVLPDAVAALYGDPALLSEGAPTGSHVSNLASEVISSTIAFAASPTTELRESVRLQIARTRAQAGDLPAGTAEILNRLLAQIDVVVRERQRSNELMLALTAVPTRVAVAGIENDLQAIERANDERNHVLRDMTILSGVLLVVAGLLSVAALRQRFVRLREDNWILHQANENAEQQLMQSAKLSSLGQMVAGISHELNTPLAYVRAVFELIKDRLTARPHLAYPDEAVAGSEEQEWRDELETLLDDGLHGLDEMASFVRSMKNFSRFDKGTVESFSVVACLENALQIAGPQLARGLQVRRELDTIPAIHGSSAQLRQVFLNLIINASDAMAGKAQPGVLTLRTRHTASDTIQIEIADNGHGIEEQNLGRIFDPFFTTKQVGKGTGMGLSISYRIIENHGGTITVQSQVGKGTVFTITLPRQHDKETAAGAIPAEPPGENEQTVRKQREDPR
ncbi:putative Integral membrane sensor signal transduction histidine kinase [Agrobacterium tumefaciens str. Kerr 14]|uniref:histidine kinase n=1 Tax=Agrobacterium tumefaciens str. Kerr 14 TaxID=1183424 RepID=A0A1S7SCG8_AGRTU|nr:DAHL domain-containing protein [Agrobacterium tumefaciens]CUX65794.1 putative Integral membrane sensor signal transduction histidine kinase [Agrobacterium tumefaciens str. Kerr 14]